MSKKWVDWSDLMKNGRHTTASERLHKNMGLPDGDVSNSNKGGEHVTKEQLLKEAHGVLKGFNRPGLGQPTIVQIEQLMKQLGLTPEQLQKREEESQKQWENRINDFYKAANTKVDDKQKDWGTCKPILDWDNMTEEEKKARNMYSKE